MDAMNLGADAVRVGTRFVATKESYAHPDYIEALVEASADESVLTEAFGVGWPNAPHRVLRSSIEHATAAASDVVGETAPFGGAPLPMPRFGASSPNRDTTGDIQATQTLSTRDPGGIAARPRSVTRSGIQVGARRGVFR